LYEDVYSNHTNTVYSFSSLVCPNYLYNPEIITKTSQQPKSKVLSAFESNGYSLNLFSEDFLKVRFSYLFDYYESESSAIGVNIHRMFAPILSQSVLIRKMFFAKDFFESITQFDKLYEELRSKIISSGPQPQFNWFHFGACHSPYHPWDTLTGFEDQYKASYITAKSQIQKTVSMIKELDSDPLIIAIGDHGAHLYRYVEDKDGKNPNEVMRARGFEPELIAKDFFSVFLGIHWPVSHYTAGETISHVRVFAHVISALSEDKRHLNDMMPNVSFSGNRAYGQTIAVRDGVPLKDWEPASKSNLASFLVKETQNNPNDISVHISLLDHYFGVGEWQNGADYALDLCNKFPSSEVIHTEASRRMIMLKEIKMATRLAHKALQINPRSGAAYCNLALAADMEGKVTEHDFFIKKTFEYDEDFLFDRNAYLRYGAALLRSGEHEQLNIFYDRLDSLGQVHFKYFIDWQMQYRSYVTSGNTQVVQWLDECINNSMSLGLKIAMLTKKIVICIKDENWEEVTKTARTLIEVKKENLGAYIVLSYSLERAGMIDEALQTLLTGYRTTKESVLLEHLGAYANRQRIHHPSLAEIKVTAKEVMKERAAHLEKAALFDATWYATEYGDLLGKMSPVDHYLNYSIALMLNPNGGFDAGYYYGNQTDVFAGAADASLHFAQFGKVDEARPYMTCLFDPTLAINTSWQAERSHATATQ